MPLLRSTLLVAAAAVLLTSASAQTPQSAIPNSCPVTTRPATQFVPPSPYPAFPARPEEPLFWYGSERLWTFLCDQQHWSHLPVWKGRGYRQKLFWYRAGLDPISEREPALTVIGRRLDSNAPPLTINDSAHVAWQLGEQPFITTGIFLPTTGCWEITAHYGEEKLSFVVWVER